MGYRPNIHGRGKALSCDTTTTGARLLPSLPLAQYNVYGHGVIRRGDVTTDCPKCGRRGRVLEGDTRFTIHGSPVAVDGGLVSCGCPPGSNRIIAPLGEWLGRGPSPQQVAQEKHAAMLAARQAEREAQALQQAAARERNRVFAKSCLRGEGCNDAGDAPEPHTHFAEMGIFRALPEAEVPQHAQAAKRKPPAPEDIPKPKKRSALYRWLNGNHEERDYQAAVAAASAAARAHTATAGAAVLEQVAGRFTPYGTWAVRAGTVAAGGFGAPVAGLLVGMMPGRLNDGEQDFIDRMRAEQMRTAPSRVRFTWESDAQGNPVPRGWHTPPGRDSVRVRSMDWDSQRQAYTFTTEEEQPVTIIWTPDRSGVHVPTNTGNQHRPILPDPVMVNPLPDSTGIRATTSPAPDEKSFADYILILPVADIPPIYIYLSKPRNGLPEDGHDYHPAPKTEEITGITGLREAKQKTPKQGGGGKRDRWIDAKGRRIYEWDSQHGELEEYRASDGEHLGSVDYKTGQQLKPAVKGRSIKRYL
ncbi:colicin E3/pyocin S6 family cytotoxin (plasmid) [Chimaeribacter arupi]|uniref:colicin E3/pyocin S6 family cytotoxin n=1 Tax=Chimaeribacter arupi TaxID=2060066 RepID=UPI0027121B7C|nr:colicin E3/pyocin S6 family cytotoxin [Chimaeribacter arupi]WKZ94405.1 colicin E3/pyocin S6 family cytotoxin [Chimaeribacter arupi]